MMYSTFIALVSVAAIAVGAAVIPISIMLLKEGVPLNGMLGRILWTIASLHYGGVVLDRLQDGTYDTRPMSEYDEDELTHVSRLGKVPFAITYQPGDGLWRELTGEDSTAVADGGTSAVSEDRLWRFLQGGGGPGIVRKARRRAFEKYAGDSQLGDIYLAVFVIMGFGIGAVLALMTM